MKLWRRVTGAIKDKNSIWAAGLRRRTLYRNLELETLVIRATSHEEGVDYRTAQRVFQMLRTSPGVTLKPVVYAIAKRVNKTRSWVVALKCLILLHGIFCCTDVAPAVRRIGRLPFDLSNFVDGHERLSRTWAHNAFVRVYFAFLDQHAVYLCTDTEQKSKQQKGQIRVSKGEEAPSSIGQELLSLQRWQNLLDLLIQIKPMCNGMNRDLFREALDCVIVEIFGVYSCICEGIAKVLARIYTARAFEASMALRILKKATSQSEKLSEYFELCKELGLLNAKNFPKVEKVPEEDIKEVERIIRELSESRKKELEIVEHQNREVRGVDNGDDDDDDDDDDEWGKEMKKMREQTLKTVITDKWEIFDDGDLKLGGGGEGRLMLIEYQTPELGSGAASAAGNPNWSIQPYVMPPHVAKQQELPDLISF